MAIRIAKWVLLISGPALITLLFYTYKVYEVFGLPHTNAYGPLIAAACIPVLFGPMQWLRKTEILQDAAARAGVLSAVVVVVWMLWFIGGKLFAILL